MSHILQVVCEIAVCVCVGTARGDHCFEVVVSDYWNRIRIPVKWPQLVSEWTDPEPDQMGQDEASAILTDKRDELMHPACLTELPILCR